MGLNAYSSAQTASPSSAPIYVALGRGDTSPHLGRLSKAVCVSTSPSSIDPPIQAFWIPYRASNTRPATRYHCRYSVFLTTTMNFGLQAAGRGYGTASTIFFGYARMSRADIANISCRLPCPRRLHPRLLPDPAVKAAFERCVECAGWVGNQRADDTIGFVLRLHWRVHRGLCASMSNRP